MPAQTRRRARMKTKLSRFSVPYVVWMGIFVVAPIIIMVIYAFSNGEGGFTWDNFAQMGVIRL